MSIVNIISRLNVSFITLGALGFRFNIVFPLAVTICFAEVAAVVVADVADVADVDAVADVVVAEAVDVVVVLSSGEFGFEMSPLTTVGISPLTTVGISPLVMMAPSDAKIDLKSFEI